MAKVRPISGFPEWLPEQRLVEQEVLDGLRSKFELFGFTPVETRSVELLETLLAKGETDKEIYVLRRLGAAQDEGDAGFGLHYDLTVPFARYAVQNYNELTFPFKRYQIQKAWRGERPQEGRYREFLQADIDVIDRGSLALSFDAEMPWLVYETLASLPFPPVTIRLNNRKVTEGYMRGIDVPEEALVPGMRVLDKLDKVGEDGVRAMLDLPDAQVDRLLALISIKSASVAIVDDVRALGVTHPKLDEGLDELAFVMGELAGLPAGAVVADMGIVRGFDYYTGTVYRGMMQGHESWGGIPAGGRRGVGGRAGRPLATTPPPPGRASRCRAWGSRSGSRGYSGGCSARDCCRRPGRRRRSCSWRKSGSAPTPSRFCEPSATAASRPRRTTRTRSSASR